MDKQRNDGARLLLAFPLTFSLLAAGALEAQPVSFQAPKNFGVGRSPVSVAVADLNGDGKPDFAIANGYGNNVSVLLGSGNGNFSNIGVFGAGVSPSSIAVGDFNRDGKPDLAIANQGSYPSYVGTVSVLLGNGNGTFSPAPAITVGSRAASVVVADLNGDGNPDLAVANEYSNTISILLGNGNGTFRAAGTFTAGSFPRSIAVGDFNGDGIWDLAVANAISFNVSVLLGNGDGTFQGPMNFGYIQAPEFVAAGDFNNDGILDLAVTNSGTSVVGVSILLGNGDGTFGAPVNFAAGDAPLGVAVADFNSDGKLDLAVANGTQNANNLSILLGNGDGTFGLPVRFSALNNPFAIGVGDFNNDSRTDIAVGNAGSDAVSVLLNSTQGPLRNSFAVISANGQPVRGNAGAFQYGTGRYEVSFPFDVSGCGYTASIGDTANGLVYAPGLIFTAGGHSSSNGVYVETRDLNGTLANYPFHLSVTCTGTHAVVNASGGLVRGDSSVVSASGSGFGTYEVVFDHDVSACAYTATIGNTTNGAAPDTTLVFTAGGHSGPNGVYLETKNMGGGLSAEPFHLGVNCAGNFAVVDYGGNLVRSDPSVTGLISWGIGRYEVVFDHDVSGCGYTATVGDPSNGLVYAPGLVYTAGGHSGPNGVYVETKNLGGGLSYYPFHLSVNCGN